MDAAFAAVVDRCVRRRAGERYPSGQELNQALERLGAGLPAEPAVAPPRAPLTRRAHLALAGAVTILLGLGATRWQLARHAPTGQALAGRGLGSLAPRPTPRVEARRPAEAAPSPGQMVALPGGTFVMGSSAVEVQAAIEACQRQDPNPKSECKRIYFTCEMPAHPVRLSPYEIGATEVTIGEAAVWLNELRDIEVRPDRDTKVPRWVTAVNQAGKKGEVRLVDLFPSTFPPFGLVYKERRFVVLPGFANKPMTHITWDGALRLCNARGMRLPTEAEWEFAARGAEGRRYPWGFAEPRCDGTVFGRDRDLGCPQLPHETADVGTSPQDRTPQGVYDLGGNVLEWVMDRFTDSYLPCTGACIDPSAGPLDDHARMPRVRRGGSLNDIGGNARAAGRSQADQQRFASNLGFRCARPQKTAD